MRLVSFLLIFFIFAIYNTEETFAYTLYLKTIVKVRKNVIRLKDVARITGELKQDRIGRKMVLKDLHRPLFISKKELQKRLQNGPEKLDWIYGSGVWIIPLEKKLKRNAILSLLKSQIAAMKGGREYLETSLFEVGRLREFPEIPLNIIKSFRLPSKIAYLRPGNNLITLALQVKRKNGTLRTLYHYQISIKIKKKVRVAFSRRNLHPGDRLGKGDFGIREEIIDSNRSRFVIKNLSGGRVMTEISKGQPLLKSNVRILSAMRRGVSTE